jgi:hypothetical protein
MCKSLHEHLYFVTDITIATFVCFDRVNANLRQNNCRLMTDWSRTVGKAIGIGKIQLQRDSPVWIWISHSPYQSARHIRLECRQLTLAVRCQLTRRFLSSSELLIHYLLKALLSRCRWGRGKSRNTISHVAAVTERRC